MELLDRIDELTRLCPCGAEPQPGFRYCGEDCTPAPGAGAPIRPDVLTAAETPSPIGPVLIEAIRRFVEAASPIADALRALIAQTAPALKPVPKHPMLAEIERRRNLVHGPQRSQRPPRHLSR